MATSPLATGERTNLSALRAVLTLGTPQEIAASIIAAPPDLIARALATLPPVVADRCLDVLSPDVRDRVLTAAPAPVRERWVTPFVAAEETVGRLMHDPIGVVPEEVAARQAIEFVRRTASPDLTYLYAVDEAGRLSGVVVFRDLFLAPPEKPLSEFMVRPPFFLTPELSVLDSMRAVVGKHFPVYPVCEPDGTILGLIRGYALFENQVVTITAQAGKLEGVQASEGAETSFRRSLRLRLPWLMINLGLSLATAIVLFLFRHTLAQFIILSVFLSVVTTQGRNSGAQTMALVLRGLTNGTWSERRAGSMFAKEVLLGAVGGAIVGLVAAGVIWAEEMWAGNSRAPVLAATVFAGMVAGCVTSCAAGVAMPLALRRLGFDPALAASILLTNLCTVLCQSLFLTIAVWWVA